MSRARDDRKYAGHPPVRARFFEKFEEAIFCSTKTLDRGLPAINRLVTFQNYSRNDMVFRLNPKIQDDD